MIIWQGWGFLVAVFVLGCLVFSLIALSLTGNPNVFTEQRWPLGASLIVAAMLSWFLGRYLDKGDKKKYVTYTEKGPLVSKPPRHSLFFIKMHWWGPILVGIGLLVLGNDFLG